MRKYLNYILFGLAVLGVLGMAVRHNMFVHGLVREMESPDAHTRSAAALELVRSEQFADSITGEPVSTRIAGAKALESLGTDSSVVPEAGVKDAPNYRSLAVKQAIALLKDTDGKVRDAALHTLQQIGDATPANLKELVNAIGDTDNYVRKGVRSALTSQNGGIGPKPGVIEAVIARMKADAPSRGPGGDILGSALFAHGGNGVSVPILVGQLTEKDAKGYKADEGTRAGAADALGKIGDPAAIDTLVTSMHTDTPQVRRVSIAAIALIADPSGEAPLVEAITNLDDDKQARSQAAAGLGKIASRHAVEVLVTTLKDRDQDIRAAAVAALARAARPAAGGPASASVLATLTHALASAQAPIRLGAARALQAALEGGIRNDRAATDAEAALIATVSDDRNDIDVRVSAANALGFPGDSRAVSPLIAALSDPSGDVGLAARDSLAAIGPEATNALIGVIKKGGSNSYYAAQALSRQGAAALPALQQVAAETSNPVAQRWAAVALGEIGISGASATLRQLAHSSNEDVAYVAKEQLSRLGVAE